MWAVITIWWTILQLCVATNIEVEIIEPGILVINNMKSLNILSDKLVIVLKIDTNVYLESFTKLTDHLRKVKATVGQNIILEELITKSQKQTKIVKSFFKNYMVSYRQKRQVGLLMGGVATLLAMGFTEHQILNIKSDIQEMRTDSLQMSNNIHIIQNILDFNSKRLTKLEIVQTHILSILETSLKSVRQEFNALEQNMKTLQNNMVMLTCTLAYNNLVVNINNNLEELKDLFNGNFNNKILTYGVKVDICKNIETAGFEIIGGCNYLDISSKLIKVNYLYDNQTIYYFLNIPIMSNKNIDLFHKVTIKPLPIWINGSAVQLDVDGQNQILAVGSKYYTGIKSEDCLEQDRMIYCKPVNNFIAYKNDNTCLASILNNNVSRVKCNWEKRQVFVNTFIKIQNKYYYSVKGSLKFEIICSNAMDNNVMSISGIGFLSIKELCVAKSKQHILLGSWHHKLNKTFDIQKMNYVTDWMNITTPYNRDLNLKNVVANISSLQNMEQIFDINSMGSRDQPQNSHFLIIYSILGIFMIAILCLLCKSKKKIIIPTIKKEPNIPLDSKNEAVKEMEITECKINPYDLQKINNENMTKDF